MEIWFIITLASIVMMFLLFYSKIYVAIKYKRNGSNDYIAIDVYTFKRILTYSMQVPMIKIDDINNSLWLNSKIETGENQAKTHSKREKRFVRKIVRFYMLHPGKLRHIISKVHNYMRLYCKVMEKFIHSLHCEQLHWKTVYGSEDAAVTGIVTGMLWTVKSLIITRLKKHVIVKNKPVFTVKSIFGHNHFNVDFQCIFSIRLGNVINAVRILYNIKR